MLTSETPEASQPQPASPLIGRSCRISTTPASPSSKPGPLQRRDALAEPAVGDRRGQDRLQARDQRRQPGRNRMRDRNRRAAEIESVHQNAGDGAVGDADTIRPFRPRDRHDDRHQPHHDRHADREIGQRLGVVEHVFGADEAGAPEHDEHRRRRARGRFFRVMQFICRPRCPIICYAARTDRAGRQPAGRSDGAVRSRNHDPRMSYARVPGIQYAMATGDVAD